MSSVNPPVDMRDPAFRDDPHPLLRALREQGRVARDVLGIWLVCGHADTSSGLRSSRLSREPWRMPVYAKLRPFIADSLLERTTEQWMLFNDPPKHTRLRRLVNGAFKPPVIEALRERITAVLCVDSGYYETFNRPNVRLVDVSGDGIDTLTPGGLRAGGRDFAFDTLVLATGFDAVTGTLMKLDLRGRGGLRIQDKWRGGPLNYLGLMTAGFPNLFNIAGAGSTSAFTNVIVSIEHHVDWIAGCIGWLDAHGHASIEPGEAAEADWVAHVNTVARQTVFLSCNSWYLGANIPGKPRMFMPLAGGFAGYADRCAAVAEKGYEGFVLGPARQNSQR